MRMLIYKIAGYSFVYNSETKREDRVFSPATVVKENPTEHDIQMASETAYNGQYAIEDID